MAKNQFCVFNTGCRNTHTHRQLCKNNSVITLFRKTNGHPGFRLVPLLMIVMTLNMPFRGIAQYGETPCECTNQIPVGLEKE